MTKWDTPELAASAHEGFHQFRDAEGNPYGSFEVFWCHPDSDAVTYGNMPGGGWYWVACFPGCLPDGEPVGPFLTSGDAHQDAMGG